MGTIQTTVQLFNHMTPTLQNITNALNTTISHFEQMQRVSGNSVDTRALTAARAEIRSAEANLADMEEMFTGVARNSARVPRLFDEVSDSAGNAGRVVSETLQMIQQQQTAMTSAATSTEQAIQGMVQAMQQQTAEITNMSQIMQQSFARTEDSTQRQQRSLGLLDRAWLGVANGARSAFRWVGNEVQNVIQRHERLQAITQRISTMVAPIARRWEQVRSVQQRVNQVLNVMTTPIRNAVRVVGNLRHELAGANSSANGLLGTIKGIAGAYLSLQGINFVGEMSDHMTSVIARLNLMNDGLRTTQELSDSIMKSAFESGANYIDTAEAIAKMGSNAGAAFQNNDELIAFMEQINKTFVLGGASATEQANAMVQLSQAMAAGALRGEELNSILDGAPGIARNIEKYMGWAEGSIKSYAEDGKVTADVVKNAMLSMAEETNEKFNSMPTTISRAFNNIKTLALKAFTPVLQGINGLFNNQNANQIAYYWGAAFQYIADRVTVTIEKLKNVVNSDKFQVFARDIVAAFSAAGAVVSFLFDSVVNGFNFVVENWETVKPILTSIAIAIGVVTAAQWALNLAMAMNPVTLVIAAVAALVLLFYKLVDAINKVKNKSISATGIIAGVFGGLYAVVHNVFTWVWNSVANVINFVHNFSKDKVAAIKAFFFDLVDNAMGCLQTIVQGLKSITDHVPKIPIVTEGLDKADDWLSRHRQNAQRMSQKIKTEAGLEDYLPKMEYKSVNETSTNFYTKVAGFADGIEEFMEDFDPFAGIKSTNDMLGDILKNLQNVSQNTKDIADDLEMDKEDLKFLRTMANIKYGDKYVTPQVKIEMVNNNTIQSEMDLDGFFDKKIDEMAQIVQHSAEGVHI